MWLCVCVCMYVYKYMYLFMYKSIQHSKRTCRVILSRVACPAVPELSTLSHKRHSFREIKTIECKICVLISTMFFWRVSHSRKKSVRHHTYCIHYHTLCIHFHTYCTHRSSWKDPLILVTFNETWIFSTFSRNPQIKNSWKSV